MSDTLLVYIYWAIVVFIISIGNYIYKRRKAP